MITIENVVTPGPEQMQAIIRGMRNPLNSWAKSDSETYVYTLNGVVAEKHEFLLGDNDRDLMQRLAAAGTDHRKFMRMWTVYADITSNHFWYAEFDTYKIGTVRNSCSKMHKIHVKEFVRDDFSHEGIDEVSGSTNEVFEIVLNELEYLRVKFNKTHEKKYWRAMLELLPMGYNIRATVMLNYEVLANIYKSRKNHKLDEWRTFCTFIEQLPYSELITRGEKWTT